ncbi:MAG TPA: hypothetical protein VMC44_03220 [Geobacteraceae bacterium]|nr:hypothetical protein [Geobacteraceae bacterium]
MKIHVKAALLSGLVLPGLGQLYKGDKVKGVILILLVNAFLLGMVFMLLKYVAPVIISAGMDDKYDTKSILEHLNSGGPVVRLLLSSFCGLWFYSWIDAAIGKSRRE